MKTYSSPEKQDTFIYTFSPELRYKMCDLFNRMVLRYVSSRLNHCTDIRVLMRSENRHDYFHDQQCQLNDNIVVFINRKFGKEIANLYQYFMHQSTDNECLDIIQYVFDFLSNSTTEIRDIEYAPFVEEINDLFELHSMGYLYKNGDIIKQPSEYIKTNITIPVIDLLSDEKFAGPNQEYLEAHKHFKSGNYRGCLVSCGQSFESLLKVICLEKSWICGKKDENGFFKENKKPTASDLIITCIDNNLFPSCMNEPLKEVAKIRNHWAHGQGNIIKIADRELAHYGLNTTAAVIYYLWEQYKQKI